MNSIDVSTAYPYPVIAGSGVLEEAGEYIRNYMPGAEAAALITDDTVNALYGGKLRERIEAAGLRVSTRVIPHGEISKTADMYLEILQFLAEEQVTRSDLIVTLGGGVVGDLGGFAAATYLRGISYIQIPTTLTAQVDSSVGGKTGVDLPAGKNLAGAFWQPRLVLCDIGTLNSLPGEVFADGCAEVIKYGILRDADLFEHLVARGMDFDREYTVTRCIEIKRDLVVEDTYDQGQRQLLNLGHTLAHAAEKLSGYRLTHGHAVAMGMASVARAAAADGSCSGDCAERIGEILHGFGLPVRFDGIDKGALMDAVLSDKKRRGSRLRLIVPREIGSCEIREMTFEELKEFITPGL